MLQNSPDTCMFQQYLRQRMQRTAWAGRAAARARSADAVPESVQVVCNYCFRRSYSTVTNSQKINQASPPKTLAQILHDSIKSSGPLSVSTFMRTCLLDPAQGYYASANTPSEGATNSRHILGAKGDFITSPEISQVFGELLAIFFVARWQATEMNSRTRLVELGPGRGTLVADMIRTFSRFKSFFNSLKEIHLVETSPGLMEMQLEALTTAMDAAGKKLVAADKAILGIDEIRVEWFPLIDSVPIQADTWSMVVAHEFFDALPTHIFEKTQDGFREVLIDVERKDARRGGITVLKPDDINTIGSKGKDKESEVPKFRYVLSSGSTPWSMLLAARNPRFQVLQPGQRVEISPESWAAARRVGELVAGREAKSVDPIKTDANKILAEQKEREKFQNSVVGGAGLIIDYGDDKAFGASFRAFRLHQIVDPLKEPGTADLTANVDFLHLKSAIATTDAKYLGPMLQSRFLKALGLDPRIEALIEAASNNKRKKDIESSAQRLIDPTGMGTQYKVLGISAEYMNEAEAKLGSTRCYPFEM